jgi:hypothetical protein
MPWFSRAVDEPGSNPYIEKTIQLLQTYNKDIKKSKFFVSITPGAPDTTYPLRSGNISLKENPSTSIKFCLLSTWLQLLRNGRLELEKQTLLLGQLKRQGRFRLHRTGQQLGDKQPERLLSPSHTKPRSLRIMQNISKTSLLRRTQLDTTELSSTMWPSEISSAEDNSCCSLTFTAPSLYTPPLSCLTESNMKDKRGRLVKEKKSVIDLTTRVVKQPGVNIDMSAKIVEVLPMENTHVVLPCRIERFGRKPKYLCCHIWNPDSQSAETTVKWTERARLLPRPSSVQLVHPLTRETVSKYPDLFRIVTPVKVDVFENLLQGHPNPSFVKSVCNGLRHGFWPWADIWKPDYPDELDLSHPQSDPMQEEFLNVQRNIEVAKGRYSKSIGSALLPCMYCMPNYAVPKPHSEKLRLIADHSTTKHSLNSMIDHDQVVGYPMDSLACFGEKLMALRKSRPELSQSDSLVIWKSDISEAYRVCPLHPFWQLKQGVCKGTIGASL